jgi:mannosyltransferase OCH1-like enzyme
MIPKKIHQIWIQGDDHLRTNRPTDYINSQTVRDNFSQNFEYTLWDDESIRELMKEDEDLLKIYDSITILAAKADIARYFILNKVGGLYLDMDFEAFEEFWWAFSGDVDMVTVIPDKLGKDIHLLSSPLWNSKLGMNNAIIGASPNNPILTDMVEFIKTKKDMKPGKTAWSGIVEFTGPLHFERFVIEHHNKGDVKIRFLPSALLEPIHPLDGTNHITCDSKHECKNIFPTAVGIHRPALSWAKAGTVSHKVLTKGVSLYGFSKDWSLVIIIALLLCIIWLGYRQFFMKV